MSRILVVEDDEDFRKLIVMRLKEFLCDDKIHDVGNYADAAKLLSECKYDVVIVDDMIPETERSDLIDSLNSVSPRDRRGLLLAALAKEKNMYVIGIPADDSAFKREHVDMLLLKSDGDVATKVKHGVIKFLNYNLNLLIVDDSPNIRGFIKTIIGDFFGKVHEAGTLVEAMTYVNNNVYDVIIVDDEFPEKIIDGHPHYYPKPYTIGNSFASLLSSTGVCVIGIYYTPDSFNAENVCIALPKPFPSKILETQVLTYFKRKKWFDTLIL